MRALSSITIVISMVQIALETIGQFLSTSLLLSVRSLSEIRVQSGLRHTKFHPSSALKVTTAASQIITEKFECLNSKVTVAIRCVSDNRVDHTLSRPDRLRLDHEFRDKIRGRKPRIRHLKCRSSGGLVGSQWCILYRPRYWSPCRQFSSGRWDRFDTRALLAGIALSVSR
jgi:hypothetical protein